MWLRQRNHLGFRNDSFTSSRTQYLLLGVLGFVVLSKSELRDGQAVCSASVGCWEVNLVLSMSHLSLSPPLPCRWLQEGGDRALGMAWTESVADALHLREREWHHHICERKNTGSSSCFILLSLNIVEICSMCFKILKGKKNNLKHTKTLQL